MLKTITDILKTNDGERLQKVIADYWNYGAALFCRNANKSINSNRYKNENIAAKEIKTLDQLIEPQNKRLALV